MSSKILEVGVSGESFISDLNFNFSNVNPQMYYFVEDFNISTESSFSHVELAAMFVSLPADATIVFSKGEYTYVSDQSVNVTKNIHIEFINSSKINALNFTGTYFLNFIGTINTWETISPNRGDMFITVSHSLAISLAKCNLLILTTALSAGGDGSYWKGLQDNTGGEICEVFKVDTSTDKVYLYEPIKLDYPTGVRVTQMNYIEVTIRGLNYQGTEIHGNTALHLQYCKNVLIEDVEIVGAGTTSIFLDVVYKFKVKCFTARDFQYLQGRPGENYGIAIYSGAKGEICECNISGGRHAIDPSGDLFPSREIFIHHNFLNSESYTLPDFDGLGKLNGAGISTHPPAEHIWYENNTCGTGAVIRNMNTVIINNKFIAPKGWNTTSNFIDVTHSGESDYFIFEGNTIIHESTGGNGIVLTPVLGLHYKNFIVRNNTWEGHYSMVFVSAPFHIDALGIGDCVDNLIIEGNVCTKNSDAINSISLLKFTANNFRAKRLVVKNNCIENSYVTTDAVPPSTLLPYPVLNFINGNIDKLIIQDNVIDGIKHIFSTVFGWASPEPLPSIKDIICSGNYFHFSLSEASISYINKLKASNAIVVNSNTFDEALGDDTIIFEAPVIKGTLDQNYDINPQSGVTHPVKLNVV